MSLLRFREVWFGREEEDPSCGNLLGKTFIPKEEKVVDYHEVHVTGSIHTKPNSINGLPQFMLNRNNF